MWLGLELSSNIFICISDGQADLKAVLSWNYQLESHCLKIGILIPDGYKKEHSQREHEQLNQGNLVGGVCLAFSD
jgi:hypothetical protein